MDNILDNRPELRQQIDRVAEETGYNRNEIITKCLEFALGNMETERDEGGRR